MALTKVIGDGIGNITGASLNDAKTIQFGSSQDSDIAHYSDGQFALRNTDSQGITFYTGSTPTEHMRINAIGAVTKPLQPAFLAHKNGTHQDNVAINSDQTITFSHERFDNNADFSSNTFTAPITGKYVLTFTTRLGQVDTGANYISFGIVTSNLGYRIINDPNFTSDLQFLSFTITVVADMDANDTAYIIYNQSAGSAQSDINGVNTYTYFSGYLLG